MKIVFLDQATREFYDAVQYYDSHEPGLGQRFEDEMKELFTGFRLIPKLAL